MKKIGFVGLGNMGAKMVINLLKKSYNVFGYDINKNLSDELVIHGLNKIENLNEMPKDIDILITMLPNGDAVEDVYHKIINIFEKDILFTDCSTIDVNKARELYKKCQKNKITFLDAPVSGGVGGAEAGTLTFMVGGNENDYKLMLPLFEVMGKTSLLCGPSGSGQATKACNNMLLAITMIGVGEAFNLGNNLGLNPEKLFKILSTSTGSCWAINSYCPIKGIGPTSPADNDFKPGFSSNLMLKDLTIALKAANDSNSVTPFGKKAKENYQKMVTDNQGNLDFSAITNFNK